jgi:hypothetical protein
MQQIHTHEESVSRQSLVEVANLVYEIVGSVAKDSTASDR